MDESDADLLAATARGDAEAFGRFYRRHEQRVLRYAIARCSNAGDVADVVGETFLAALGAAARFSDDGGDAVPWLLGIARRVLSRQRRSRWRQERLVQRQELLRLVSADGLSPAQAGAALGMNANTARIRLSRARARLQSLLATTPPTDPHPEVSRARP